MSVDDWKSRLPNRSRTENEQRREADQAEPYRASWLDILALIIATYQVLALPLLLLLAALGLVVGVFLLVFR